MDTGTTPERSIRVGLALTLAYFGVTILVAADATEVIDEWWNDRMIDAETAWLVRVAEVLGTLGSVRVAVVIAVLAVAAFAARRRWWPAIAVAAMAIAAFVVSQVTKSALDRPRPPDGLEVETSASYPSASVMVSATAIVLGTAVVVAGLLPRRATVLVGCALAYVIAMAWSRTYLRVHWLSDVVGGAIGGAAAVALSVGLIGLARRRRAVDASTASVLTKSQQRRREDR